MALYFFLVMIGMANAVSLLVAALLGIGIVGGWRLQQNGEQKKRRGMDVSAILPACFVVVVPPMLAAIAIVISGATI